METCFEQEDCSVHFESTLEYSVFGNYRYTQRVFFEVQAARLELLDEAALKGVGRARLPVLVESAEERPDGRAAALLAAESGV